MSEINSSEKPLVVIDLSDSPPEAAQAGPARSPVQDALDQAGRAVQSVAQAIKVGVEPIVKAVRTSPVGEALNKILPGVFGEGGTEGVRPVRLFDKEEAKVVVVSDDDEPASIDTMEQKREEAPDPVKKELERKEDAPAPVTKEPEVKDDASEEPAPVTKEPEVKDNAPEEPVAKKSSGFSDGLETDYDYVLPQYSEEAPENQLPVAQAVKYEAGGQVDGEVNVNVSTDIYVFGSKPSPVKPPVKRLDPIPDEETPKPISKSEGVSRYRRVDTEDDDEEQAGDEGAPSLSKSEGVSRYRLHQHIETEDDEEEKQAGDEGAAGGGAGGWRPGGDGGAGGSPGEGWAGGSFEPTDAEQTSGISRVSKLAVDDNTLIEIELAESRIHLAQEDLNNPDLKPNEKKSLKTQIQRAHDTISKLLKKTVDADSKCWSG